MANSMPGRGDEGKARNYISLALDKIDNVGPGKQGQHRSSRLSQIVGHPRQLILVGPKVPLGGGHDVSRIRKDQLAAIRKAANMVWMRVRQNDHIDVAGRKPCFVKVFEEPARGPASRCCLTAEARIDEQILRRGLDEKTAVRKREFAMLVHTTNNARLHFFLRGIGVEKIKRIRHLAVADDVAGHIADGESLRPLLLCGVRGELDSVISRSRSHPTASLSPW
jgi:hypothetical protein